LDEQDLFQGQLNFSATLHRFDTIMHRATTLTRRPELDVNRILEELKSEKQEETSTPIWPIVSSMVICILILLIGYYNQHYLKTVKGKWINRRATLQLKPRCRTRIDSSLNLNETFQTTVPIHVSGPLEQETTEGREVQSRPHTPFVQRGKVPAPTVFT
jgi:hypothetical protein